MPKMSGKKFTSCKGCVPQYLKVLSSMKPQWLLFANSGTIKSIFSKTLQSSVIA